MGVEAFVVRFDCPTSCEPTAIGALTQSFDVIQDVEEQILNSSQQLLICVENREVIQLRVASSEADELQPIYMRFAYCCPDIVDEVFILASCALINIGCKCTIQSDAQESIESCEKLNSILPEVIATLRQNWFDSARSQERVLLKPDEVWDYFFDFTGDD